MSSVGRWLDRERSLWVAWLILVAASLVLGEVLVPVGLGASLGVAVYYAYLLLLMHYLRGSQSSTDPRSLLSGPRLGPWGYIWRSSIVLMVTLFLLFWTTVGLLTAGPRHLPPWASWLAMLVLPPIVTWLGFGHDRMVALKRLFSNRRGDGV